MGGYNELIKELSKLIDTIKKTTELTDKFHDNLAVVSQLVAVLENEVSNMRKSHDRELDDIRESCGICIGDRRICEQRLQERLDSLDDTKTTKSITGTQGKWTAVHTLISGFFTTLTAGVYFWMSRHFHFFFH